MEELQKRRRDGSITSQGEVNVAIKMVQCFSTNLEAIFNKYSQYDVSLSALTEVESEKAFSMIYSFSSHNGTVAMNPPPFVRGFGRATAYLMATNAAAESFFNSSVELRSNKVYKAISRRVP